MLEFPLTVIVRGAYPSLELQVDVKLQQPLLFQIFAFGSSGPQSDLHTVIMPPGQKLGLQGNPQRPISIQSLGL